MAGNGTDGRAPAERPTGLSEPQYRAMFEAMDTAVLLMRGPACVACNPASARLFGLSRPERLVGKTPLDFAPPTQPNGMTSAAMVENNFKEATAKGTHAFEWLTTRADGQPMTLEVRFTMLPGAGEFYQCTASDISERKRAEQALRDSEARFRTFFERAIEGILVSDAQTKRIRFANPAMCRLVGYELDELITLEVADLHPSELAPEVTDGFDRQRRGVPSDVEIVCRRKDGSLVPVHIRSAQLELAGQGYVAAFFTDLTSRRQLDEERLKSQKLEAVGRLAGGIAHDFNNLLQGVFGFISLARLTHDDKTESLAMLEQAEKALHQSVHLTTQLLTFAKGGLPMKAPLAVGPLVRTATTFALSGSRADCRFAINDGLAAIDADEGQITQVLQNIVLNAAQAMPLGGTVHVAAAGVRVPGPGLPLQLPSGRFIAISVRDSGVGISPQYLSKIFDPYFTTKEKGSGLGLATSYAIINNHRGLIDVQSVVGEGSTFTIYLPALEGTPAGVRPPADGAPPRQSRTARVLLMDDDPVVRDVAAKMLRSLGHIVDIAEHGSAAIDRYRGAMAAGTPYHLVILDLTVRGGVGGVETAHRLRQLDPRARLVVSSGYSDDTATSEYGKLDFLAFLKKPYDLETLRETLAPLLG